LETVGDMSTPSYYDILGVPLTATPEQIRAAHRVQSRKYHPDTADDRRGDPALFAQIQEAYETLSVPDVRRRYDKKQATLRGEVAPRANRRPPKSPCDSCKKPVFASQLVLYLGRYMCQTCFERKRARDAKRPTLTGWVELRWQIKRLAAWSHSHMATIVIVLLAMGAASARVAWVGYRTVHSQRGPSNSIGSSRVVGEPATADGPTKPPSSSSETAEIDSGSSRGE
jgi:hypothetical protein